MRRGRQFGKTSVGQHDTFHHFQRTCLDQRQCLCRIMTNVFQQSRPT